MVNSAKTDSLIPKLSIKRVPPALQRPSWTFPTILPKRVCYSRSRGLLCSGDPYDPDDGRRDRDPTSKVLLASSEKTEGAATINQDARVSVAELEPGTSLNYDLGASRYAWLHVIDGDISVNGTALKAGDAVAVEKEPALEIAAHGAQKSEILLFDLV